MTVSVTSQYTVLCANKASWTTLELPFRHGAFDQVAGFVPIQVVWVYEQQPDGIDLIPVKRLQRALERLLDYYPQFTGRLHIDPSNGIREITCLGTGAELLVARCTERLDAFSSPGFSSFASRRVLVQDLPDAGNGLLPPFDPSPEGSCRAPILAVQHTRFACGGVALGVRIHHTVCDGAGFFQVMRDLAELYRAIGSSGSSDTVFSLSHPPHIRPYMSELVGGNMAPEERQAALDYKPAGFYVEPPTAADGGAGDSLSAAILAPRPPTLGRFFRYSSSELAALKAKATDPSDGSWVSTFEALAAHIYQRVHRARLQLHAKDPRLGELSRTDFLNPIDLRGRLKLGARYSPNALFAPSTTIQPDILATGPLWQVAKAVHDFTRSDALTLKVELDHTLKWIAAQPDMRKILSSFQYGTGSFMASQWNKFDMYLGAVFDVGPILVSPPFTQSSLVDGLAYFLPTEELATGGDAGAIDVSLALSEPVWAFMDFSV
ncbi:transferase family-domain-containing protein [Mycena polygramma]|nr:transferase family-domain-containing protein [Mycena polygramma]